MLGIVERPSQLGERDSLPVKVGTMTDQDRLVNVDCRVHLSPERVIGDDTSTHLDNKIVETTLVRKDNGM